jgi:hypothetical protein
MLSSTLAAERFPTLAGRDALVVEPRNRLEQKQLSHRAFRDIARRALVRLARREVLGQLVLV